MHAGGGTRGIVLSRIYNIIMNSVTKYNNKNVIIIYITSYCVHTAILLFYYTRLMVIRSY